jgi:hypothetical protein
VYALLYHKVQGLKSGEVCVYHSGFLAADRTISGQLDALAASVGLLADEKRIRLCQRRFGEMLYDYLAVGCE